MSDAPGDDLRSLDERLDHLSGFTDDEAHAGWTPPLRRVTPPPPDPDPPDNEADVSTQLAALVAAVEALGARVDDLAHAKRVTDQEVDDLRTDLQQGGISRSGADEPTTAGPDRVATMAALQELRSEMREATLQIATAWQRWRDTSGASIHELSDAMAELLERQSTGRTDAPGSPREH